MDPSIKMPHKDSGSQCQETEWKGSISEALAGLFKPRRHRFLSAPPSGCSPHCHIENHCPEPCCPFEICPLAVCAAPELWTERGIEGVIYELRTREWSLIEGQKFHLHILPKPVGGGSWSSERQGNTPHPSSCHPPFPSTPHFVYFPLSHTEVWHFAVGSRMKTSRFGSSLLIIHSTYVFFFQFFMANTEAECDCWWQW